MYEDHISVLLERGFHTWEANRWDDNYRRILINPEHFVDFLLMKQFGTADLRKQRPVKRGGPGERGPRPSDERFSGDTNFLLGEFKVTTGINFTKSGGCWLGDRYMREYF